MLRFTLAVIAALAIFAGTSAEFVLDLPEGTGLPELYLYEDKINETLQNISKQLSQHDPLSIPKIQFDFGNDMLRVDFEAEDLLAIGFSKFVATDLKLTVIPPKLRFNIYMDKLQLVVPYYNMVDTKIVFIPFYGSGNMNLLAKGINVGGSASVSLGGGTVKDLKLNFNLTTANLQISGLLHNEPMSQIVSAATTECFPEFVNTYGEHLGGLLGGVIEKVINGIISKPKPDPEPEPEPQPEPQPELKTGIRRQIKDTITDGRNTLKYNIEI